MSQHHRKSKHTTHAPKIRKAIAARLPLPCVDCQRPVLPEQKWEVGHIIPASQGGRTTLQNCGPSHYGCNRKSGGKLGAAVTNGRRLAAKDIRPW